MRSYSIPTPPAGMHLGDIELLPFSGGENIAQYVAFAASVSNNASDLNAIERIGIQVGNVTANNEAVQIVNIPLLGAGAGNLDSEKVVMALKKGFESSSASQTMLIIHVLDESAFESIGSYFNGRTASKTRPSSQPEAKQPVRVFMSWTRTNELHHKWTESLARFLRDNGVNARIDLWHLRTGMDLPQFMTNELAIADKVVIVSNAQYVAKADGRTGGVGWETMIIQGDMSRQPPDSTKYITVVREEDLDAGLPQYLRTKYVMHWTSNQSEANNRQRLLHELLSTVTEPPIGVPPVFV